MRVAVWIGAGLCLLAAGAGSALADRMRIDLEPLVAAVDHEALRHSCDELDFAVDPSRLPAVARLDPAHAEVPELYVGASDAFPAAGNGSLPRRIGRIFDQFTIASPDGTQGWYGPNPYAEEVVADTRADGTIVDAFYHLGTDPGLETLVLLGFTSLVHIEFVTDSYEKDLLQLWTVLGLTALGLGLAALVVFRLNLRTQ